MGPFDHIQKKGSTAIKPQPVRIRKELVHTTSKPRQTLNVPSQRPGVISVSRTDGRKTRPNNILLGSPRSREGLRKRSSPVPPRLESDSSDGESDERSDESRKRQRLTPNVEMDSNRQIRSATAFVNSEASVVTVVQAADIASLKNSSKYIVAFPSMARAECVFLQYPSLTRKERYDLVKPVQSDDFKPLEDIKEVLHVITNFYLPESEMAILTDPNEGLLRRLKRATDRHAGDEYTELIQEWNDKLLNLTKNGTVSTVLDNMKCLDLKLIERILTQTYSRTVSLHVHKLSRYENGTDNVYGELLPKFVSDILTKDTKLKSGQIFVDLGSGVGNVVLQAALEIGCESWGCEVMENACDLAELQEKEFKARCQLWGLAPGTIHLERGDFLTNMAIGNILRKADVVLVNNQAFTPELNEDLRSLFLDLKEGCKIVSLKSFVPSGHKITTRNLDSVCNVLDVVEKRYYSACVSWTDAPGTYYISIKDRSKLLEFTRNL